MVKEALVWWSQTSTVSDMPIRTATSIGHTHITSIGRTHIIAGRTHIRTHIRAESLSFGFRLAPWRVPLPARQLTGQSSVNGKQANRRLSVVGTRLRSLRLSAPVTPRCHQARVGTIRQWKLASGYRLGNPLDARHNGRFRPRADYTGCSEFDMALIREAPAAGGNTGASGSVWGGTSDGEGKPITTAGR
jgi:hypothetical protein